MSSEKKIDENLIVKPQNDKIRFELSRILRFILVTSFILLNITFSADVGVIATSKFLIQKDLKFNEKEFAIFNSITSTGRILATFVYMGLMIYDNRKILTLTTLLGSIGIFFSFKFTSNKYILYSVRFLLGFTRNFFQIYVPVYVDQFGVKPLKTIMMSICNITSPLGRAVGFSIGSFLGEERWRTSFSVIGWILLAFWIIFLLSPINYFSGGANFVGYYTKNKDGNDEKLVSKRENNERYGDSIFEVGEIKVKKGGFDFKEMLGILKNPSFMFATFTRASVSFIFDISHLFIKDYVRMGLKVKDEENLKYYYSLASIVGPSIGGAIGGFIVTLVGGYEHKNSAKMISLFSFATLLTVPFVCFTDTLLKFSLSLFMYYVTAYMFYPIITGYTVNSLPPKQKGTGYSFTILACTICGNFPGPLYYGTINDLYKAENPRLAWRCSFFYYIVGFTLLQFSCYYRYKFLEKKAEEDKKAKEEQEMQQIENIPK